MQPSARTIAMTPLVWILAVALAFAYADVFVVLVSQWSSNDAYSHGFIIPLIAAYIVKRSLEAADVRTWRPAPLSGTALVCVGVGLLLLGRVARVHTITQVSLLPVLAGVTLLLLGTRGLRVLAFPIAYLSLMMPAWDILTERLHLPFQVMSANVGAVMARAVGVPIFREDLHLVLPNITLEVAKVCSGVNYLIAVVAMGLPVAWFTLNDTRRRLLLLAFALCVAVGANWVRVASIAALVHHGWEGALHGPGHMFQGLSVALVGYVAIFSGATFLSRWNRPEPHAEPDPARTAAPWPRVPPAAFVPVLLVLLAAGVIRHVEPGHAAVPPQLAADIPRDLPGWSAAAVWSVPPFQEQVTEGDVVRAYRASGGGTLAVLRVSPYGYRGDGRRAYWTDDLESEARSTSWPLASGALPVRRAVLTENGGRWVVVYWFATAFGETDNRFLAKVAQTVGPLLGRGGALVYAIAAPLGGDMTSEALEQQLSTIAAPVLASSQQRASR